MKTAVIGSGGWGTALALVLLENGNEVSLICRREDKCRAMALSRENPQLKDVRLPDALVPADSLLREFLGGSIYAE